MPLGGVTLWVFARTNQATLTDHLVGLAVALLIHALIKALIIVRVVTRKRQLARPSEALRTKQLQI